jgi:hypothetical protein
MASLSLLWASEPIMPVFYSRAKANGSGSRNPYKIDSFATVGALSSVETTAGISHIRVDPRFRFRTVLSSNTIQFPE